MMESSKDEIASDTKLDKMRILYQKLENPFTEKNVCIRKFSSLIVDCNKIIAEDEKENSFDDDGSKSSSFLLKNEVDELMENLLRKIEIINSNIEDAMKTYNEKCKPVISDRIPIPLYIRNSSNELLVIGKEALYRGEHEKLTLSHFYHSIKGSISFLMEKDQLDYSRDTEEELENILRIYPEALRLQPRIVKEGLQNIKTVAFVPIVVQLCHELCSCKQYYHIEVLSDSSDISYESSECTRKRITFDEHIGHKVSCLVETPDRFTEESDEFVRCWDEQSAIALRRFMELGYLKKEKIRKLELLHRLKTVFYRPKEDKKKRNQIHTARFRFLVNFDPLQLLYTDKDDGYLPLHCAATKYSSVRGFQLIFEAGLRYFPIKKGFNLLFQNVRCSNGHYISSPQYPSSPYQCLCGRQGKSVVDNLIEETLQRCSDHPYDPVETFLTAMMMTEKIDLNGIYLLLRRRPDVLESLSLSVQSKKKTTAATVAGKGSSVVATDDPGVQSQSKIGSRKRHRSDQTTSNKQKKKCI